MNKSLLIALAVAVLPGCNQNQKMNTISLTQEWDKTFALSEKVNHRKVTFDTQFGFTLAGDLYEPGSFTTPHDDKLPAIAVCGPFGASKEQSSGLYAMCMAERGFVTLAFDPSYTANRPEILRNSRLG